MLVLTRKEGEAVVIPRALVRVTVTRIDGNRVKLGFEAPYGFDVFREELLDDLTSREYRREPNHHQVRSNADEQR
jgi:carbon storage regulator CsrA